MTQAETSALGRLWRGAAGLCLMMGLIAGDAAAQSSDLFNRRMSCREPNTGNQRVQIAGGETADLTRFPFIVKVQVGRSLCGGSLIARGFVLTAAHCVMPTPDRADCVRTGAGRCALADPSDITVVRPDNSGRARGTRRGVTRVFAHPKFDYINLDADVAILRLDAQYDIPRDQLVNLADTRIDANFAAGGECARVAGWGYTSVMGSDGSTLNGETPEIAQKLQSLNLELVEPARCKSRYPNEITGNMLCAGDGVEGFNTCKGDSGGPLVVDIGVPTQVGVVSWAYGCAQKEEYTIFSRVGASDVRGWIDETLR